MIMLGTYFSHADLRAALKRADTYISAAVKLIAFPLVMILLFRGIGIRGDLLIVASVAVGVPTASNTAMFAAKYGKDTALASQLVGFSSVLSIITLPACVALGILLS